jgi:hypothetical protein
MVVCASGATAIGVDIGIHRTALMILVGILQHWDYWSVSHLAGDVLALCSPTLTNP